ncbi:MAG TPA: hypothetical protein VK674_06275 [Candidatus Limnocylindria bacterium]|nr:hypothetical protein [Candidatus Limnocylindria bacterium]
MADVHYTDPSKESELPPYDDQAAADYVSNLQPIKDQKQKKRRNKLILLIIVLVLVAGGAAAYFLVIKKDKPTQQAPQTTQPAPTETQPEIAKTEKHTSSDLALSFDYPGNWQINDSTQGLVKVESPLVKLKDVDNQPVDAKVVVTLLSAGSEVPGFSGDGGARSATAVQDSKKITYTSPSQNQREQTYLSFADFGRNGLDAVFITGDSGYKKDQNIPEGDIKKIEPIISVTFVKCQDTECSAERSELFALAPAEWTGNRMLQAAQDLLESLSIQ